jgi:hypothetical protein
MPTQIEPCKKERRSWFSVARGFNEDGTLNIMASTENVDRHGEIVRAEAFKPNMKVYRTNPVILAAHEHWLLSGESPVIARSEKETIIPKVGLEQLIRFIPAELYPAGTLQLGPLYEALYRQKFMNTFSIGFIPVEWRREDPESRLEYIEIDHLETSAVVVPSNRESLAKAADENGAGSKLAKWCLKHLSGDLSERDWDPQVVRNNLRALQGAVRSLRIEIGEAIEESRAAIIANADTGNVNIQLDPEVDTLEVIDDAAKAAKAASAAQDPIYDDLPERGAEVEKPAEEPTGEPCTHCGITSEDVDRVEQSSRLMQDATERNEFVLAQMEGLVVRAESAAKGHPTSTEPSQRDSDATGAAADDKADEIRRGLDRINAAAKAAHNGRS